MEKMNSLLTEENKKEAVAVDYEPDPDDIADWQYKDWLETQFMRELEDELKKNKR
jgi:hypothetical protein